jgi:hypothetical protein
MAIVPAATDAESTVGVELSAVQMVFFRNNYKRMKMLQFATRGITKPRFSGNI